MRRWSGVGGLGVGAAIVALAGAIVLDASLAMGGFGEPAAAGVDNVGLEAEAEAREAARTRRALERELAARREAIVAAAAAAEVEWVGSYYDGDGLGMNAVVAVAPEEGLVYTWHGCMGLYGSAYGPIVHVDDEKIVCQFEHHADQMNFIDETLYRIRWGDRRYLAPARSMEEVCLQLNEREQRVFGALLHRDDRNKSAVDKQPVVPKEFRHLVLDEAVVADVTESWSEELEHVMSGRTRRGELRTIRISAGSNAGLRPKMRLYPHRPGWRRHYSWSAYTIESVEEESAVATGRFLEPDDSKFGRLDAGSRVTTRQLSAE